MCGLIQNGDSKSIIVAGGYNGNYTDSVEILDEGATEWRDGAHLPAPTAFGTMIEDQAGCVIMIGGGSAKDSTLDTLLKLEHPDGEWKEMGQKLKNGRRLHVSFLIPDHLVSCF